MEDDYINEAEFGDFIQTVKSEDLPKFPYNCVGYFFIRLGNKYIKGTGFLIGQDLVLTAAHNICSNEGNLFPDIKFYPGISGELRPQDACEVADVRIPPEYKTSSISDPQFDYALVKLKRSVPRDRYI